MVDQILAAVGSVLILFAYAANQMSRLGPDDVTYGLLNAVGGGLLAVAAVMTAVWGFVALEGTWAVVSVVALVRIARHSTSRPELRDESPKR